MPLSLVTSLGADLNELCVFCARFQKKWSKKNKQRTYLCKIFTNRLDWIFELRISFILVKYFFKSLMVLSLVGRIILFVCWYRALSIFKFTMPERLHKDVLAGYRELK